VSGMSHTSDQIREGVYICDILMYVHICNDMLVCMYVMAGLDTRLIHDVNSYKFLFNKTFTLKAIQFTPITHGSLYKNVHQFHSEKLIIKSY
jgi:hypothetical protein